MKTVEQLAEIVLNCCSAVSSLGEPTQRFRIGRGCWFIRDRGAGDWLAIEDPATLVRAALLRYCCEHGRNAWQSFGRPPEDYAGIAKQAYDNEVIAELVAYLGAAKSPRSAEYCFDTISLEEQSNRLSFLTSGSGAPIN